LSDVLVLHQYQTSTTPGRKALRLDHAQEGLDSIRILAVISVVFCLITAGAHFFELANKMSLSTAEYMTTQKIYAGWAFFGVAIIAAIIFTLTHTLMVRAERARAPLPWRHASDLLDVHLSHERRD
jgi:hypothetical protein